MVASSGSRLGSGILLVFLSIFPPFSLSSLFFPFFLVWRSDMMPLTTKLIPIYTILWKDDKILLGHQKWKVLEESSCIVWGCGPNIGEGTIMKSCALFRICPSPPFYGGLPYLLDMRMLASRVVSSSSYFHAWSPFLEECREVVALHSPLDRLPSGLSTPPLFLPSDLPTLLVCARK